MNEKLESADPLNTKQFMIAVKRLSDSLTYGTDSSQFLGQGLEYVQSRLYQSGDSMKAVDWRVTAKMGKLYVKDYEVPKTMPVWIAIDTSSSMQVSSLKKSKYALALQVAGGLAMACLERVSPVGVIGVGERSYRITPSLSKVQVMKWMQALRHFQFGETTMLGEKLKVLESSLKSRSVIILLSDFYDESVLKSLRLLAAKHDCMALQFRDPAEDHLRGAGFFHGLEAESGHSFVSGGKQALSHREQVKQLMKDAQVDYLLIETDKPLVKPLRHFLQSRGMFTGKE